MITDMTITGISDWKQKKCLIYLNDEAAFALYKSEVRKYALREGENLSGELYEKIVTESLLKRAKSRALHILDKNDKTEMELKKKLREEMYPEDVIESVLEAAKKGRYLDDLRYASQYIYEKSRSKSRRIIQAELNRKGVDRAVIERAFSEFDENAEDEGRDPEYELILKLVRKRCPDPGAMDMASEQKLINYLTAKGFGTDKCIRAVREYRENY